MALGETLVHPSIINYLLLTQKWLMKFVLHGWSCDHVSAHGAFVRIKVSSLCQHHMVLVTHSELTDHL